MFKTIFKVLGYFLTVAASVTVIWGVFTFVDNKNDADVSTQDQLEIIIAVQETEKVKTDSISVNIQRLNRNINHLTKEQKSLRQSYVRYLSNDDALTKDDFLEYMQGIELDIKKNGSRN